MSVLQQYLPFTVLKRVIKGLKSVPLFLPVATVLTVYGIETLHRSCQCSYYSCVATVLTVYGIETYA